MNKIRKDRWDFREVLKLRANRFGDKNAMHPQVQRELERGGDAPAVKHRMYCAGSGMRCFAYHSNGVCPDVRDCKACKLGLPPNS